MKEEAPERNCDIVMKGGITSGVVYPLAIIELADEFRFKNIGGTSAGAIAAAVTAAAEYRRVTKKTADGFRAVEQIPEYLKTNLLGLFPPVKATRGLFRFALAFVGHRHVALKALAALAPLMFVSPWLTLLFLLPALAVVAVVISKYAVIAGVAAGVLLVIAFLLLIAGLVLLAGLTLVRALCYTIPKNDFGISTGRNLDGGLPGISEWLHGELQTVAGLTESDPPLTFGDLWTAEGATLEECREHPERRSINLQMITTAVTHGRPYRLPFETKIFSFKPSELLRTFPAPVVEHMKVHGNRIDDDHYELGEGENLPVVVAARMSLSFPLLFAMVPLYAVDYTLCEPARSRCWFIDGGLSSNFPLTLFDATFPRWPTFGIDLSEPTEKYPIDETDQKKNVWMVPDSRAGRAAHWHHIAAKGVPAVSGYLGAILDAIRNWHDNTQMATPGFLDRVVHVNLDQSEGGLNLNMPPEVIRKLTERGTFAGKCLIDRFGAGAAAKDPLNWNSHRWTRYLIGMALLQEAMRDFDDVFSRQDPPYPTLAQLVARNADADPKTGYWWKSNGAGYQQSTIDFAEWSKAATTAPDFARQGPSSGVELRVTPKI